MGTVFGLDAEVPRLHSFDVHLAEFQDLMARTYLDRDRRRGMDATFRRLVEEVGELAPRFARATSASPSPTRGVGSGEASADPWVPRGSAEGTPLVTEAEPSVHPARREGGAVPCSCPFGP